MKASDLIKILGKLREMNHKILKDCLNFIQSVLVCLDFQTTYFMEHLLMAAFIHFRSTGFSEQLKVHALFIAKPSYFFLGIILFQESLKKNTYLQSHFHNEREFHHCFSSCFHDYVLCRHSLVY